MIPAGEWWENTGPLELTKLENKNQNGWEV
jgi:hypothetical protein